MKYIWVYNGRRWKSVYRGDESLKLAGRHPRRINKGLMNGLSDDGTAYVSSETASKLNAPLLRSDLQICLCCCCCCCCCCERTNKKVNNIRSGVRNISHKRVSVSEQSFATCQGRSLWMNSEWESRWDPFILDCRTRIRYRYFRGPGLLVAAW